VVLFEPQLSHAQAQHELDEELVYKIIDGARANCFHSRSSGEVVECSHHQYHPPISPQYLKQNDVTLCRDFRKLPSTHGSRQQNDEHRKTRRKWLCCPRKPRKIMLHNTNRARQTGAKNLPFEAASAAGGCCRSAYAERLPVSIPGVEFMNSARENSFTTRHAGALWLISSRAAKNCGLRKSGQHRRRHNQRRIGNPATKKIADAPFRRCGGSIPRSGHLRV